MLKHRHQAFWCSNRNVRLNSYESQKWWLLCNLDGSYKWFVLKSDFVWCGWQTIVNIAYPRSRIDLSCVLVRRLGSPEPSIATASNSLKGGATKRSRKLIDRYLRLTGSLVDDPLSDTGVGRALGKTKIKILNQNTKFINETQKNRTLNIWQLGLTVRVKMES